MQQLPAGIITESLNSILTQCAIEACPPTPKRKRKTKIPLVCYIQMTSRKVITAYHAYQQVKHLAGTRSGKLATLRVAKKLLQNSVCPALKQSKPRKQPNSHRRITITLIVVIIIELHIVSHSRPILDPIQSKFQFGFTNGCSPIYVALMLIEIIADAKTPTVSCM